MSKATDCIKRVAAQTEEILLFHSATGKDSIALLDLCAPYFKRIVCVFMYSVPNMECTNRYIRWAEATYSNAEFLKNNGVYGYPHFNVSSYIKTGYLGCRKNEKQKILNLVDVTNIARKQTGIEWAAFGMKEADSLNRRVFLRTYDDGINFKTKKFYPLHLYKHPDIAKYIHDCGLITPVDYGEGMFRKSTSSGESVESPIFLNYLRKHFPKDLERVFMYYPDTETILYKFDQEMGGQQQEFNETETDEQWQN